MGVKAVKKKGCPGLKELHSSTLRQKAGWEKRPREKGESTEKALTFLVGWNAFGILWDGGECD